MSTTKSIKGTRTEANLVAAYMAESMAYTRYMYYAKQADKDGYPPIRVIFEATANNEMHHSKVFFKFLEGGKGTKEMTIDAGVIGSTAENLATAAAEEEAEGVVMYTNAAKIAREEGFDNIADVFESIAKVELFHRERFLRFLDQVQKGTVWKRDTPIKWQCLVCGYVYEGTEPPTVCPACAHPSKYYMDMSEMTNYAVD